MVTRTLKSASLSHAVTVQLRAAAMLRGRIGLRKQGASLPSARRDRAWLRVPAVLTSAAEPQMARRRSGRLGVLSLLLITKDWS